MPLVLLDPQVVLNPLSFALHLAVFSERDRPVLIPLGWLWEEMSAEFGVTMTADIFGSRTGKLVRNLREPLYTEGHSPLIASSALLATACTVGLARGVATSDWSEFLQDADWASYLGGLVGNTWIEEKVDRSIYQRAGEIAAAAIGRDTNRNPDEIIEIYKRNVNWDNRTPDEYPIYERFRKATNSYSQIYAFLRLGYQLSTPARDTRRTVQETFGTYGLVRKIDSSDPMVPIVRKVSINPAQITVEDVIAMAENKQLLAKLGAVDVADSIDQHRDQQLRTGKALILFFLGLVPVIGTAINAISALDLARDAASLARTSGDGDSLLYAQADDIELV